MVHGRILKKKEEERGGMKVSCFSLLESSDKVLIKPTGNKTLSIKTQDGECQPQAPLDRKRTAC